MARSAYKIPLAGGPQKGTSSSSELEWLQGKTKSSSSSSSETKETEEETKEMTRSAYKIQLGLRGGGPRKTTEETTKPSSSPSNNSKFGKADPVRDLLLFAGFLGFMFLVSWLCSNVGKPVEIMMMQNNKGSPSLGSLHKYQKQFMDILVSEDRKQLYRYDCELFLAPSSIKDTGLSIFAGKNYSQGEEIMSLGWPLLNMAKEDDDDDNPLFLPPYALLMKHHPTLVNVKPSAPAPLWTTASSSSTPEQQQQQPVTLIATQPITAGQELFLDFENHPHSHSHLEHYLFRRIPTAHDYKQADDIILEERLLFKVKNARSVPIKRSGEVGMGLRMTLKAVARYAPRVAKLLPTMAQTLVLYATTTGAFASTSFLALHNQTHKSLAGYDGACLSNNNAVQPQQTSNDSNAPSRVAIPKGRRVLAVPLYIRKATTSSSCDDSEDSTCTMAAAPDDITCLSRADSFLEICPLDGVAEIATTPEQANIVYRWSSIGGVVNATNKRPEVIAEKYFADLAWDALALRDIEPGEKLFVALSRDPTTGRLLVPDVLFPEKWREL